MFGSDMKRLQANLKKNFFNKPSAPGFAPGGSVQVSEDFVNAANTWVKIGSYVFVAIVAASIALYLNKITDTGSSELEKELISRGYAEIAQQYKEEKAICADSSKMKGSCLGVTYLNRHPEIVPWPPKAPAPVADAEIAKGQE